MDKTTKYVFNSIQIANKISDIIKTEIEDDNISFQLSIAMLTTLICKMIACNQEIYNSGEAKINQYLENYISQFKKTVFYYANLNKKNSE